jgi:RimJ/RimL family protein N-acetyltransferase
MPARIPAGPLRLDRWAAGDAPALLDAVRASFAELHRWMPWAAEPPTAQVEESFIAAAVAAFDAGDEWAYAMHETATGALVGSCTLFKLDRAGDGEIGYWVRTDRGGRGYATRATVALTAAAFTALPWLKALWIRMDGSNVSSAAVAERAGYTLLSSAEPRERAVPGDTGTGLLWQRRRPAPPA